MLFSCVFLLISFLVGVSPPGYAVPLGGAYYFSKAAQQLLKPAGSDRCRSALDFWEHPSHAARTNHLALRNDCSAADTSIFHSAPHRPFLRFSQSSALYACQTILLQGAKAYHKNLDKSIGSAKIRKLAQKLHIRKELFMPDLFILTYFFFAQSAKQSAIPPMAVSIIIWTGGRIYGYR